MTSGRLLPFWPIRSGNASLPCCIRTLSELEELTSWHSLARLHLRGQTACFCKDFHISLRQTQTQHCESDNTLAPNHPWSANETLILRDYLSTLKHVTPTGLFRAAPLNHSDLSGPWRVKSMINQIVLSAFWQCIAIAQCLFIDIHLRNKAVISAVIEQLVEHQM